MWLARWSLLRFISQHPREPTYEHSRASFASMICGRTSLPVRIANRYKERNPVEIPSFRLHVVFKISLSHGWRTGGYSMLLSYCAVLLIMLNIQQGLTRWGSSQPYPPLKRLFVLPLIRRHHGFAPVLSLSDPELPKWKRHNNLWAHWLWGLWGFVVKV